MDPEVRAEAGSHLANFFQRVGQARQQDDPDLLGGLAGQMQEFMSMPLDLAMLFANMAVDMTEMILTTLEEGGFILVKGLTPA